MKFQDLKLNIRKYLNHYDCNDVTFYHDDGVDDFFVLDKNKEIVMSVKIAKQTITHYSYMSKYIPVLNFKELERTVNRYK